MTAGETVGRVPADNHDADNHDVIRVAGARENNLLGVNVIIPKRRLMAGVGFSSETSAQTVMGCWADPTARHHLHQYLEDSLR